MWKAIALASALFAAQAIAPPRAGEVTIYRSVGSDGRRAQRDTPCAKGETQQVRSMQRPRDPAPGRAPPITIAPNPPAASAPQTSVVYRTPPQPMYECVDPDGRRYSSDNGEGNPRWVPLWTLGYPALARVPVVEPGHAHVRVDNGHVSGSFRSGSVREAVVPTYAGMGGGTWVRDTCHQLPPQEVCARLSDRRYEIQRRYYSALQSERRELDLEQRGIDARLANDCGTY